MKAQLTIEYMMILVIMLLLFNSITLDLVNTSISDTNEIQTAEMVNISRIIVSDAVGIISMQGSGAKKNVTLRAPSDCDYMITATTIGVQCESTSPTYSKFNDQVIYALPAGSSLSFTGSTIASGKFGTVAVSRS